MAEIPLSPQADVYQPVDVGDLGASAIAQGGQMLGGGLENLGNTAIQTYKANSRSTMFNQLYLYSGAVNDARTSIIADPSDNNISSQQNLLDKNFADSQNLGLTPRDSASMNKVMQSMRNTFNLQAQIQSKKNNNISLVTNLNNSLPSIYGGIHEAASLGDNQTADNLISNFNDQLGSIVSSGGLTPDSAQRLLGLAANMKQRGSQLAPYLSPDAFNNLPAGESLISYEKSLNVSPSIGMVNPQNPSSQQLANIDTNAFTIDDAKQQAVQGNLPKTFLSRPDITNDQFNSVLSTYQGAAAARSLVMLGSNYNTLNFNLKTAQNIPFPNAYQDAYRASLKSTVDNIQNNSFDYYTKETSNGREALTAYNNSLTQYSNSPLLSPSAKASYAAEAQNDFVNKFQGFALSHGIPQQYIKPFPANDPTFQTLGNAFIPGGDVSSAMSVINSGSKMTPYYISSLKDPVHQAAATLASFATSSRDQSRVLLANQNNVPGGEKAVPLDSDGKPITTDSTLKLLSGNSNFNNYKNYLQDVPGGTNQLAAMQKAILNSANLCMTNTNNNQAECVQQVAGILPSSRITGSADSGGRYNFIPEYFGNNVSNSDASALADYAVRQGYQKLQGTLSAIGAASSSQQTFNVQKAVNGLTVINTPFHTLQVINPQTSKVITEMPITDRLLTLARMNAQKNDTVKGVINPESFGDYVANIDG
jgi:hypothetical protein